MQVSGTKERPRLSVFKSNTHIYAQIIDDTAGKTLAAANDKATVALSAKVGAEIAKKAIEQKIKKVVFDRGGYIYTGIIKALADGAREGGLEF